MPREKVLRLGLLNTNIAYHLLQQNEPLIICPYSGIPATTLSTRPVIDKLKIHVGFGWLNFIKIQIYLQTQSQFENQGDL